jgi:hypothetical protein
LTAADVDRRVRADRAAHGALKTQPGTRVLRRIDFTPPKLSIEIDRPRDNLISVTLAMAATEFAEAS